GIAYQQTRNVFIQVHPTVCVEAIDGKEYTYDAQPHLRIVLFACKAAIESVNTAHKDNAECDILISVVIEVFNDLGDQHFVDGESRSIIFLCDKLVGNGLNSGKSSLDLAAFAFALVLPSGHRSQNLLAVHVWIKRGPPRRSGWQRCIQEPLQLRLLAQHVLN